MAIFHCYMLVHQRVWFLRWKPRGSRFWSDLEVLIKQDRCKADQNMAGTWGPNTWGKKQSMMILKALVLWWKSHRMFSPGSFGSWLFPPIFLAATEELHRSGERTVVPLICLSPSMGQYSLDTVLTCSEMTWYSIIERCWHYIKFYPPRGSPVHPVTCI